MNVEKLKDIFPGLYRQYKLSCEGRAVKIVQHDMDNMLKEAKRKHKEGFISKKEFREQLKFYENNNSRSTFAININKLFPVYTDRCENAGTLGNYFWQDLWTAKKIYKNNPVIHYDIGSRIDGFIAHLASFREKIVVIDVRPLDNIIPGVEFIRDNATDLKGIKSESIESLSSLCALEHFGLGRYGDNIDPDGCFKAFKEMQRVVKKGGYIYISVPIGKEHLEFNAHRIFSASTIVNEFSEMQLEEYSAIKTDGSGIEYNVDIKKYDKEDTYGGAHFGLFCFKKQ